MPSIKPITIGITMGDPSGVGPELAILGASRITEDHEVRSLIIGDAARLRQALEILQRHGRIDHSTTIQTVESPENLGDPGDTISVLDLCNVPTDLPWGVVSSAAGGASYAYLERAVVLAMGHRVDAICTAPIHKKAWELAGISHPGHTEALARLSDTKRYAMMLKNRHLRVVHATTHIPFSDIIPSLTSSRIVEVTMLADQYLRQLGLAERPIAIAGLNPHAGDGGLFGTEEDRILGPAVQEAQHKGLMVYGPLPADTVFARGASGEFAAVIALYHDQGHIPIKMLGLDTGVNQTIGLPIIRTSVDHGTAFDVAGTGSVRDESMYYALKAAKEDAASERQSREGVL